MGNEYKHPILVFSPAIPISNVNMFEYYINHDSKVNSTNSYTTAETRSEQVCGRILA